MLSNQEKIDIVINRLNNLALVIQSYIDHSEALKDKYSLEDKLAECNVQKSALLKLLDELGGTWS